MINYKGAVNAWGDDVRGGRRWDFFPTGDLNAKRRFVIRDIVMHKARGATEVFFSDIVPVDVCEDADSGVLSALDWIQTQTSFLGIGADDMECKHKSTITTCSRCGKVIDDKSSLPTMRQIEVARAIYWDRLTYKEAAKELGYKSASGVAEIIKRLEKRAPILKGLRPRKYSRRKKTYVIENKEFTERATIKNMNTKGYNSGEAINF